MMKKLIVAFLLIILSFHVTTSSTLNYQIVEIPQGSSSFSYELIKQSSDENHMTPIIFMKFSGDVGISFYFGEEEIFSTEAKELNYLLALPVKSFTSIGNKPLEFKFQNNNTESITMAFIDTSKEINISFEQFLNWTHDLKYFMSDDLNLSPIIFNIDTIPEKLTYKFNTTIEGSLLSDNELLYYCIKNGNKCNYKPLNTLTFSEGKSYKIKLNPCTIYLDKNYFFFPPIQCTKTEPPKIDVQEIQFGLKIVEIKNKEKKYYLVNTKSYNNFYVYTKSNFYYTFITEDQKNNLEDEIDNFIYENGHYNYEHFESYYMDYLLIEIYDYGDYVGSIALVNKVYEFYENYVLQIKNDEYSLLEFHNEHGYENNIFLSSTNNMLLVSDLSYGQELTNKISKIERHSQVYIFIDSLNHTSTITGFSFNMPYDEYKFNLVTGNELENAFKESGNDYTFTRTSSHTKDFGFNSEYFFDLKEEYYFYIKKYFGNVNFYSYNKPLDRQTKINEIVKPILSYEINDYK